MTVPGDPVAQQKGPLWTNDTKLKRPIRDRINFVPSSQLMTTAENISERTKKGVRRALSKTEPHSALPHAFQGPDSPQVLRESMGPPVTSCTMGGSRTAPFRVRDEDFYSILSLNSGGKNDDPEEETHLEEELVSVGMQSPCSPSRRKRSQSLGTLAPSFKNKTLEGDPENCRAISCRRSEFGHGSLNINNAVRSVTEQPSVGPKMFQDPRLRDGESAKETDSGGSANKKKSFYSGDTKFEPRQDDCLNAENVPNGCPFMAGRPSTHNYERDRQDFLNRSGNSSNCLLSGRPTALRSSVVNSSYNTPGLFVHSTVRDDTSIDLSMASSSVDNSDSEGNARFNNRRPLSPIRNRNPFTRAEHLSDFPVNSNCEFYVRGADNALTSQPQGAPSCSEDPLLNPQDSLFAVDSSSISPSEINRQDQLHVPMFLQENILLTSYAVSALPTRNVEDNLTAISVFPDEKEDAKIKTDPEKLKKLQESLLEEDSEEEEDLCRICQIAGGSLTNPLLEPCGCVGSLRFVHQECLKKWLQVKITSGADLGAVQTCEMCKQVLLVDLEDLNMNEFYRKSRQSRAYNELMNSSLYLVLLLHLYEQRFAELMRLNYNRVIRERILRWEMGMKAAFITAMAGSSSNAAGRGVYPAPSLHLHAKAQGGPAALAGAAAWVPT
ncbi:putative E3 ubiquitin-protein ligase MARCHF10 [Rhynchocyon petersi]